MRYAEVARELRARSDPRVATILGRRNPGVRTVGVRFGDLQKLAKRIGSDHGLARRLWGSGLLDARHLATMIEEPSETTAEQIDAWVKDLDYPVLSDMFAGVVYRTPWAASRMRTWTRRKSEFVRRAGFALVYDFAADPQSGISDQELLGYLDQIGREIHASANWARETMNLVPIAIGKRTPALLRPALACTRAYGKVEVFHGDKTNCKVWDATDALRDPRVKVKVPQRPKGTTSARSSRR